MNFKEYVKQYKYYHPKRTWLYKYIFVNSFTNDCEDYINEYLWEMLLEKK